ncbi:uncharacterized protein LOC113291719 [Papaver somniferum]|uniref:uncharacterized protein LOC113291719 n=1 Tax=Papaver somniferum TaxID=3469 RepID=UPI000E6FEDE1|nr:uncharacterized protein LOC113291719 [Papaver somniferum]
MGVFEEQFGDDEKSYSDLTWYVKAIEETNPDSYVNFEVDHGTIRFQRIFICFGACKHSYRHLRPMIYLDATFLTGRSRGDANSKVFIDLFYKAAYSYTSANFEEALRGMHVIGCGHVANYIMTIPKEKWENAFFLVCRYNAHSSTLSESFNNWILDFKKLPDFSLLDAIRLKVMKMNSTRWVEGLETFNTRLTSTFEVSLKENIDIGHTWIVTESMERSYEVASPRYHYVDLLQQTCTCHRWRVNGFLCAHACDSIQATRENIYSFVEPYFTTEGYNGTYQEIIFLIPNYDKPRAYDPSDKVIFPILVPPPGRRRTQHMKNAWEKQNRPMMYTKCFTLGHHNRATRPML